MNLCSQVKNQHFGVMALAQFKAGLCLNHRCVALMQLLAINLQLAAYQMHIGLRAGFSASWADSSPSSRPAYSLASA